MMKAIARYLNIAIIAVTLMGSTGCLFWWGGHDHHEHHDDHHEHHDGHDGHNDHH
jgi:hypothetical protein